MSTPNLDSLPPELVFEILEYLEDLPHTVEAISQTNKALSSIAKPFLHLRETVEITSEDSNGFPLRWLDDEHILHGTRHLTITSTSPVSTWQQMKFENLNTLVKRLVRLETITWAATRPMPLELLDAIHTHPEASLIITSFTRTDYCGDHNDPTEIELAKSPALTSISTSIWNAKGSDLRKAAFTRIVAQAPNLRHASVRTGASGCVVHGWSMEQGAERRRRENLFETHSQPNSSVRSLDVDGFADEYTLSRWNKYVNLGKLNRFNCHSGLRSIAYLEMAPLELPRLKEVHFRLSYFARDDSELPARREALKTYFDTCQPLESISLWHWYENVSLPALLDRHGQTLKKLVLHQEEPYDPGRPAISITDLQLIATSCPALIDLTIDINRSSTKPKVSHHRDLFNILRSMPLKHLRIYLDLGLVYLRRQEGLKPTGDEDIESYVSEVWKYVFTDRRPGQICELEMKVGEWERTLGVGYPARFALSQQDLKSRWIARPHERDDKLNECVVSVEGRNARASEKRSGRFDFNLKAVSRKATKLMVQ
jgi:hypothetical protein